MSVPANLHKQQSEKNIYSSITEQSPNSNNYAKADIHLIKSQKRKEDISHT